MYLQIFNNWNEKFEDDFSSNGGMDHLMRKKLDDELKTTKISSRT